MCPSFSFPRSLNTERLDSSPFLSLYLASLSRLMVDGGARVNAFERQSFRGLRILCRKASWCGILVKCFYDREWSKVVFRFSVGMNGSCVVRSNFWSEGFASRSSIVFIVFLAVDFLVRFVSVLSTYSATPVVRLCSSCHIRVLLRATVLFLWIYRVQWILRCSVHSVLFVSVRWEDYACKDLS